MFFNRENQPPISEISIAAAISKPEDKYWALQNLSKEIEQKIRGNGISRHIIENLDPTTLNALLKELEIPMGVRCQLLMDGEAEDQETVKDEEREGLKFLGGWVGNRKELRYWIKAFGVCLLTTVVPTLVIGLLHYYGHDEAAEWMIEDSEKNKQKILEYQFSKVFFPAMVILLIAVFLTPRFALFFVAKLNGGRSKGVAAKNIMDSILSNSGIIAALLLTVVFSALQAESPVEDNPLSLLNMYYSMFLLMAIFFSFTATIMSSVCYLYMQPLNGAALKTFMGQMALYYGEPTTAILLSVLLLLNAMILWVWGQYGASAGICAVLICYLFCVRIFVCIQNLNGWENPYLLNDTRKAHEPKATRKAHDQKAKEQSDESTTDQLTTAKSVATSKSHKSHKSYKSHKEDDLKSAKSFTKVKSFRSTGNKSLSRARSFRSAKVSPEQDVDLEEEIAILEDDIRRHERNLKRHKKRKSQLYIQESKDELDHGLTCGMEIFE